MLRAAITWGVIALALAVLALAGGHGEVRLDGYRSAALRETLPFAVYLPSGYSTSGCGQAAMARSCSP